MMKAIQRFGGALFTPAMLFAFAGVVVGLGTLFTTESIMGPIAAAGTTWTKCWTVILDGGWTVFNQLPLLFAVALPIGLAKKQAGRCCLCRPAVTAPGHGIKARGRGKRRRTEMWTYEKKLQYPVRIKTPNARTAKYIISQLGGLNCKK